MIGLEVGREQNRYNGTENIENVVSEEAGRTNISLKERKIGVDGVVKSEARTVDG